ncbi:hypothetical protein [Streptomyces atratus]|uniref:hypothetical protein n=1 Tax=Streptomyces atratus TaxID=1893 RepID=UPI00378AC739
MWTDTPLELNLFQSGLYELDADVRGRLVGTSPVNAYITARLWDVTSGAAVPDSERLVYQTIGDAGTGQGSGNGTAPISEVIYTAAPTRIRLQAKLTNAAGAATVAQIYSDNQGFTSLRYHWIRF